MKLDAGGKMIMTRYAPSQPNRLFFCPGANLEGINPSVQSKRQVSK